MPDIERMNLESTDLVAERIDTLKGLFPEIVTEGEGSIDFDKLRLILGDNVDDGSERYAFTWPGKAAAIRQSQTSSNATLRPCIAKSRGRDGQDGSFDSDNIYIEGDNLEVLKLLQRGYHGRIKMIYIDPPYNTGSDFVYKDDFGDTIANYKRQTGLVGQSNADTSGRYHSDWCSMMYPRLRLARELLREDGVMFISIDDNELCNLTKLCQEVFGDGMVMGSYQWHRRQNSDSRNKTGFSVDNEYILVLFKSSKTTLSGVPIDATKYKNPDNDPRGPWASIDLSGLANATQRPNLHFDIVNPETGISYPPNPKRGWSKSRDTIDKLISEDRILWPKNEAGRPREKKFLTDLGSMHTASSSWLESNQVGFTTNGTREVSEIFSDKLFDFPKPTALLKYLISQGAPNPNDIILDFFSGSASSAHAVVEANRNESGYLKYIMVQLPELCPSDSPGASLGFETLCDIGEERIRRAGNKIKAEVQDPTLLPDIGFRVFTLDESGIQKPGSGELLDDVVRPDRSDLDIVFEVMLKWGLELTLPVERADVAGYPVWSVACNELVCCMSNDLTHDSLEAIAAMEPRRVLILDSILTDTLKLNAIEIFKHAGERAGREIELRTI